MQSPSFRCSVLVAVALAGCTGAEAVGVYSTDGPLLRAALRREVFAGKAVPDAEVETAAQVYTLKVTLQPDGTVGLQTVADEFFDCGTWRQSGSRVDLVIDTNGTVMRLRASVDDEWLRLQMPLERGELAVPLRRAR